MLGLLPLEYCSFMAKTNIFGHYYIGLSEITVLLRTVVVALGKTLLRAGSESCRRLTHMPPFWVYFKLYPTEHLPLFFYLTPVFFSMNSAQDIVTLALATVILGPEKSGPIKQPPPYANVSNNLNSRVPKL